MDADLVTQSLQYHGAGLLEQLEAEQADLPLPDTMTFQRRLVPGVRRDPEFQQKLHTFIARKADLLFEHPGEKPETPTLPKNQEDHFAIMPPIETFMGVPPPYGKKHFYESLEEGDIVIGMVTSVQESGLIISLLCLDGVKAREIDHLKVMGFCPIREVPRYYAHESPLEAFTIKDKVRGVVLSVATESEKIIISLQSRSLPSTAGSFKIGLISDEELPVHYVRTKSIHGLTFNEMLDSTLAFTNPSNVRFLCDCLGLDEKHPPSLMRGLHGARYPKSQYAEHLRKNQSYHWSMKSVAEGILHFKAGRHTEAMQYLNKALQIDEGNVEALVARGALYANHESYDRAIENFSSALKLDHSHQNARKYMVQTVMAKGRSLYEGDQLQEAKEVFENALSLDGQLDEACHYLVKIKEIMSQDKVVGKSVPDTLKEDSVQKPDTSGEIITSTTETLRRMIKDDEEQRLKKRRRHSSIHNVDDDVKHRRCSTSPEHREDRIENTRDYDAHSRHQEISPGHDDRKSEQYAPYKQGHRRRSRDGDGRSSPVILSAGHDSWKKETVYCSDEETTSSTILRGHPHIKQEPRDAVPYAKVSNVAKYQLEQRKKQDIHRHGDKTHKNKQKDVDFGKFKSSSSERYIEKVSEYHMSEKQSRDTSKEKSQQSDRSRQQMAARTSTETESQLSRTYKSKGEKEKYLYKERHEQNKSKTPSQSRTANPSGIVSYPESPSSDEISGRKKTRKRQRSSSSSSSSTTSSTTSSSSSSSSASSSSSCRSSDIRSRSGQPSGQRSREDFKPKYPVKKAYYHKPQVGHKGHFDKSKVHQYKGKQVDDPKTGRKRSQTAPALKLSPIRTKMIEAKRKSFETAGPSVLDRKKSAAATISETEPEKSQPPVNKELLELENFLDVLKQKKKEQTKTELKDFSKIPYKRWSLPQ